MRPAAQDQETKTGAAFQIVASLHWMLLGLFITALRKFPGMVWEWRRTKTSIRSLCGQPQILPSWAVMDQECEHSQAHSCPCAPLGFGIPQCSACAQTQGTNSRTIPSRGNRAGLGSAGLDPFARAPSHRCWSLLQPWPRMLFLVQSAPGKASICSLSVSRSDRSR